MTEHFITIYVNDFMKYGEKNLIFTNVFLQNLSNMWNQIKQFIPARDNALGQEMQRQQCIL